MKKKLLQIYDSFDTWARDFDFACTERCATCCTRSVTMTTLEGELIVDYIRSSRPELLPLLDSLPLDVPAPRATTNRFAAACIRGEDIDEQTPPWNLEPCIFLRENRCTVYPVRSFMCRSFGSKVRCDRGGVAEVDPLFLTLNTTIMQCIEHLDQGSPWGNMNTILQYLAHGRKNAGLPLSEKIPGFLFSPEEADKLHEQIQTLLGLVNGKNKNGGS